MDQPSWTAAGVVPLRPWRSGEVIASPETKDLSKPSPASELDLTGDREKLIAAEHRAEAAERDRDWWKAQHDVIMSDWQADVREAQVMAARLAAAETAAPARLDAESACLGELSMALKDLLAFFEPQDGSILLQRDGQTLSDVFRRTASLVRILGI
jgi:hypothetical protein